MLWETVSHFGSQGLTSYRCHLAFESGKDESDSFARGETHENVTFLSDVDPWACRKSKSFLRSKSSKAKAVEKGSKPEAEADQSPTPADDMSYQQDPLLNHPHFKKIKDLNEGTFGFVQLARDIRRDEPASLHSEVKLSPKAIQYSHSIRLSSLNPFDICLSDPHNKRRKYHNLSECAG